MTDAIDDRAASREHLAERLRAELRIVLVVKVYRSSGFERAIDTRHLEVSELLPSDTRRRKCDPLQERERAVQMFEHVATDHEIGRELGEMLLRLEQRRAQLEVAFAARRA